MASTQRTFVVELFAGFGPVSIRRVFSFDGLYFRDTMFGLFTDGRVYLKTDTTTRNAFEREGSAPLHYKARDGAEMAMSYYELPARLYDEPAEAAEWARAAHEVARRSPTAQRKKHKRRKASGYR